MEQVDKVWRKSSYTTSGGNANCVELGQVPSAILVRDTKNREGHTMHVTPGDWLRFTGQVKAGNLSLLCVASKPPGQGRRGASLRARVTPME